MAESDGQLKVERMVAWYQLPIQRREFGSAAAEHVHDARHAMVGRQLNIGDQVVRAERPGEPLIQRMNVVVRAFPEVGDLVIAVVAPESGMQSGPPYETRKAASTVARTI